MTFIVSADLVHRLIQFNESVKTKVASLGGIHRDDRTAILTQLNAQRKQLVDLIHTKLPLAAMNANGIQTKNERNPL